MQEKSQWQQSGADYLLSACDFERLREDLRQSRGWAGRREGWERSWAGTGPAAGLGAVGDQPCHGQSVPGTCGHPWHCGHPCPAWSGQWLCCAWITRLFLQVTRPIPAGDKDPAWAVEPWRAFTSCQPTEPHLLCRGDRPGHESGQLWGQVKAFRAHGWEGDLPALGLEAVWVPPSG